MSKLRSRLLPVVSAALVGALLAGGGYALAGGSGSTISGCVVLRNHDGLTAGELLIQSRCGRGERAIDWNTQGPRGIQGQVGPPGPPAARAWAWVAPSTTAATLVAGENLSVQRIGVGRYEITPTGPCQSSSMATGALSVTPLDPSDGGGQQPFSTASYPVALVNIYDPGPNSFDVQIDNDAGGTLTPEDDIEFEVSYGCV